VTEAATALLRLGFGELGLHRLTAKCSARNAASARLMERLGMRREGHLVGTRLVKGEWRDELVYAMLADEWVRRSR
jgi:RimJ/RimL family protein N-acetyltransferase